MRWRALAVAAAGLAVTLAACDFDAAWRDYCRQPGRCTEVEWNGGIVQISQGSVKQVVLPGSFLRGVVPQAQPAVVEVATVDISGTGADAGFLTLSITAPHGTPPGDVALRLAFDPAAQQFDRTLSPFLRVTPIVVADGGRDDGEGTFDSPFGTLERAHNHADGGDVIYLLAGTYRPLQVQLKSGVTVRGEDPDASVIDGSGSVSPIAFDLNGASQRLETLSIQWAKTGVRIGPSGRDAGARPVLDRVTIENGERGVEATAGADVVLRDVHIYGPDIGLVVDGGNVEYHGGAVAGTTGVGILMTGGGGSLLLDGVSVRNAAAMARPPAPEVAGLSIACTGGTAWVDGGVFEGNSPGIAISGLGNTLQVNGTSISPVGANRTKIGLMSLPASEASVFLQDTTITGADVGIEVSDFQVFNGGDSAGGWGGNTLNNPGGLEIHDARPAGSTPPMTFAGTTFRGRTPPAGLVLNSVNAGVDGGEYGIKFDNPGNQIRFY